MRHAETKEIKEEEREKRKGKYALKAPNARASFPDDEKEYDPIKRQIKKLSCLPSPNPGYNHGLTRESPYP